MPKQRYVMTFLGMLRGIPLYLRHSHGLADKTPDLGKTCYTWLKRQLEAGAFQPAQVLVFARTKQPSP